MPTHAFFILSLSLLLPPAFAENVPSNIGDARKALKESEVRLDLVVASWQQASDQLQKMANCEYNDTKDQDIKEIQDNNKTLQKALSRLKASLRKIENDGKAIFESPSNVTACDGAPKDLGEKTLKFQQLINSEFDLNFPSNRQHEVDQVARNARPNLQRALQKYRGWNCNSSKGALDMIGAEACRRYKVCSRGVDPAAIYQNVLTHLDKGKQAWISSAEQRELSVKETLKGLREVASKESSRLFELASSCQSAGDLAAGDLKKEDTASPPPAPAPVAPVKEGSERAPATIAQTPRLDPPHPAPAEAKNLGPTVSSPIAGVTGAILRAEQANPTREPDSPKAVVPENKEPPPVAAAPATKTVAAVNSDNSPWAAPNWKDYDRYKESIGAPNIVNSVDLNKTYTSFLASNSIRINNVDDALRLQRAINAASIEVNGPDSIGPSVYQDGVVGQRTKSAIYMMQSNPIYKDVFLRELRRQGFST